MSRDPRVTEHAPSLVHHWGQKESVFFGGGTVADDRAGHSTIIADMSRQAAELDKERDRNRNCGAGRPLTADQLELRQAVVLGDDHEQRVAALETSIYERGIGVDDEALLKSGRERFEQLLAAEIECRSETIIGSRCDLTSFDSAYRYFARAGAVGRAGVPERTVAEQLYSRNKELDQLANCKSFDDWWKLYGEAEPRAARAVSKFHRIYAELIFGQSMYTWVQSESHRIHNRFFASGGSERKVSLFQAWLPALKGPHFSCVIRDSLAAIVFWLAGEKSAPTPATDLAKDWCGVRVPSQEQNQLAQAVLDSFVLGYSDEWVRWQFVGRATGKFPDKIALDRWYEELRRQRFPRVAQLHLDIGAHFWKAVGDHQEFQSALHRDFLERTVGALRNRVAEIAALTIEENLPAAAAPVVGKFPDWILCQGRSKAKLAERVTEKLQAAFPGASFFTVEIQ